MLLLGIETSCDETSVAVVENGTKVLSNVISSQIQIHEKTGGVVPEVAAREHVVQMIPVIELALKEANISLDQLNGIAVTQGPGLLSSLIIGVTAANTLAASLQKPLIPVNHIAGHIYANRLERDLGYHPQFPLVVLTVSGGHNQLILMRNEYEFELLGETLDDAAGEAFDKIARILGLSYPGGPQIAQLALQGDPKIISLPNIFLKKESLDFSFSGLKTAVMQLVEAEFVREGFLSDQFRANVAAAFQETVCEVLSNKLLLAAQKTGAQEIHLAGGVSANQRLRALIEEKVQLQFFLDWKGKKQFFSQKLKFYFPTDFRFCTDNAAMIAAAGYFQFHRFPDRFTSMQTVLPDPQLQLCISLLT